MPEMEKSARKYVSDWIFDDEIHLDFDEDGNVLPGDLDEETVDQLMEDPEFVAWLDEKIAEAENDPRPSLTSEEMDAYIEAMFAENRRKSTP